MLNMEKSNRQLIDLCVPIYLDEQIVFDLLAMLDDGFSSINIVSTSNTDAKLDSSKVNGSFGKVISLIPIAFSGNKETRKTNEDKVETWKEKTHTPSSMFSILRLKLISESLVKKVTTIDDIVYVKCGDIVEFRSNLTNNSLIDNLNRVKELLKLANKFEEKNRTQKGKTQAKKNNVFDIDEQISALLEDIMKSNSTEIIGEISEEPRIKVDLSSKNDCFMDNDISHVMNGEFYVFGKVTKVIQPDSKDTINLLRKTTFRSLGKEILKEITEAFENIPPESGIDLPKIRTTIEGPVIQVLPFAIFI
jgi:hypothetical protein